MSCATSINDGLLMSIDLELYSIALQPPTPCIRAHPNRGPGTAITEPCLTTEGGRAGEVKVKELVARSKNPVE